MYVSFPPLFCMYFSLLYFTPSGLSVLYSVVLFKSFFPTKLIMCSLWSNLLFHIFIESKFHLFHATKNSFFLQIGLVFDIICSLFPQFIFLFIHYIQMSHIHKIWCFCFMKFLQFPPHGSHSQYFTLGFCDFKILWANVYWNHICESF